VRPPSLATVCFAAICALALGCDRAVEPYVPGEEPSQPDLSRIFPEGAERATKEAPMPGAGGARPGMPGASANAAAAPPGAPSAAAAASGDDAAPLSGTITLGAGYERKAPAGAILFLIARPAQGGGPPLAVKRIESPEFPFEFSLGPDDRMIKTLPFVGPLQLSARLDADGNAMTRAPGDLQGQAAGMHQPGDTGISIVIDQAL